MEIAKKMTHKLIPTIDYPSAFSNWLDGFLNYDHSSLELAICSNDAIQFAKELHKNYVPNVLVAGTANESKIPFLQNRYVNKKSLFYICKNKTCQLPADNFSLVLKELQSQ
jgi:uncharacterized protein YyaL (SSP411 family)